MQSVTGSDFRLNEPRIRELRRPKWPWRLADIPTREASATEIDTRLLCYGSGCGEALGLRGKEVTALGLTGRFAPRGPARSA